MDEILDIAAIAVIAYILWLLLRRKSDAYIYVPEGTAMAYLIAPPLEAMYAMDFALKAAEVELRVFYGPPTETNFAGGLLTGEQAACRAACIAFAEAVEFAAAHPDSFM